ncbi:MAG: energy-coupling factor transporter transmembrane protein EcfT [Clostridia bacterium]|nr:energy-coupling factor transporter transmembrane protein EcfT [Clostridia bacterium]MCL6521228.1 energy-coupling factor transporter transmembrane protein EcfT [Bacillota bacterium]
MPEALTIGHYVPGDSPVHRLDSRVKLLLTMAYVVVLFFAARPAAYAALLLLPLAGYLLARMPLGMVWQGLRPVAFVLLLTVVLNALMTPGHPLYRLGRVAVTAEGLRLGLEMAVRLILLMVTSTLLTLTTSPIELTDGLESLLRPFRRVGVPAHELAMMMTIALRFIPTLLEEAQNILKAQQARGADFESGNLLRRARAMVPLLVPLFVGAFRRADELATAMEARCYHGGEGRTRYREYRIGRADWVAAGVTTAALLFVLLDRLLGV